MVKTFSAINQPIHLFINQFIYQPISLSISLSVYLSIHLIHFLLLDMAKLVSSSQTAGWVLRQNGLGRGTVDAPGLEFPNLVLETPAPTQFVRLK